jgi:GNAT superfamily N-acetyltransferase
VHEPGILTIERAAFEAWPAAEVRALGGWRLRFNHDVTHRGGSVWPGPGTSPLPLEERITEVERFYAAHGAPAWYQLSPVADPPELERELAARGYVLSGSVSVELADAARIAALPLPGGAAATCEETLPEAWFELSGRRGRFRGAEVDVYRALLGRLAGRAGFASVRAGGEVAAVGLGVVAPPLAGVFSMLTLPEWRGRRLGEAVLAALARWARARGAERLYLQVETDNAPARRLYARAGFVPRYEYHYRHQEAARP